MIFQDRGTVGRAECALQGRFSLPVARFRFASEKPVIRARMRRAGRRGLQKSLLSVSPVGNAPLAALAFYLLLAPRNFRKSLRAQIETVCAFMIALRHDVFAVS